MNPRRWFPRSRVAGWIGERFGWHRTSPLRFGPDGRLQPPEWTWHHCGRKLLRAIREVRKL